MPTERDSTTGQVASVPQEVTGQPRRVVVGGATWRDTFAALQHRNFRLFFIGQLVSLIGSWMQNTAQSWLVYQLTGSKVLLGTVAAVGSLPLLLSPWGGSMADRHPKRTVVLFTQTAMMGLAFVFAALVGNGHIRPWHILVLAGLGGLAMAFDMPARQAFMVEMTSREHLMNAISLNSSIVNGARVVGPAVAGLMMAHVGMTLCFLANGLSFLAVIAGLLLMRLPRFVPPAEPASTGRHMLEGFIYVANHRRVRLLLLLFAVVGVFGWSYSVLLPAYARDGHPPPGHRFEPDRAHAETLTPQCPSGIRAGGTDSPARGGPAPQAPLDGANVPSPPAWPWLTGPANAGIIHSARRNRARARTGCNSELIEN